MNKLAKYTAAALAGILALGCQRDGAEVPEPEPVAGDETSVVFSMQLPGNYAPETRALDVADEYEVSTVEVLVFEKDGDYLYTAYARDLVSLDDNTKTFTVTLKVGTYDIMVLTNSRHWIDECFGGRITPGTLRADIEQQLVLALSDKWQTDKSDADYHRIPMWGERRAAVINASTSFTGNADKIRLTRMLAKIDVAVDAAIQSDFKLKEIYLYNNYEQGLLIPDPDASVWDATNNVALAPSTLPGWTSSGGYLHYTDTDGEVDDEGCQRWIYTFEAPAGTMDDYRDNTFLVIGAEYLGELGYYRIDFAQTVQVGGEDVTAFMPLLRNHVYNVNIMEVDGEGLATHSEAARHLPMNIETEITVRNEGDLSYYVYDGQYYLGADPHKISLWSDASSGDINVNANNPEGWDYCLSETPEWGGTVPSWLDVTGTVDNGVGATGTVSWEVDENSGATARTAYIVLRAGRLLLPVEVTQYAWKIISVEVDPVGNIPRTGQTRRVIVTGNFDDIEVRAYDLTNGQVIDEGTVPGSSTSSTADLIVDAVPAGSKRVIAFQYKDFHGQWQLIRSDDQARVKLYTGRIVAEEDTNINGNGDPNANLIWTEAMGIDIYYKDVYFYTTYGDDIDNRSYIATELTGCGAYNETGYPAGTWRLSTIDEIFEMATVHVDALGIEAKPGGSPYWSSTEDYKQLNPDWAMDYYNGGTYPTFKTNTFRARCVREDAEVNYRVSSSHQNGAQIDGNGEPFTFTATGFFPHLPVRVWDDTNSAVAVSGMIAGHFGANTVELDVPVNGTGASRTLIFQYSPDQGTTWIDLSSGIQPKFVLKLSSGRVIAEEYATTGNTWAFNMGISMDFDNVFLYTTYNGGTSNNRHYIATERTGCGAYSEQDYPAGTWRLPTIDELEEIAVLKAMVNNWDQTQHHWSSTEAEAVTGGHMSFYILRNSGLRTNTHKYTSFYARCVREDADVNYTVTSDLADGSVIAGGGKTYTITANGFFPHLPVRVWDATNSVDYNVGLLAGNFGNNEVKIFVPNNGTGAQRTVYLQYSTDGGTSWVNINHGVQSNGNVVLTVSPYRVVAAIDGFSEGVTGTATMSWAVAMGLTTDSPNYNETFLNDHATYTPNAKTGCGAYYEGDIDDPKTGQGQWRLPTVPEMQNMHTHRASIGNFVMSQSVSHWTSQQSAASSGYIYNINNNQSYYGYAKFGVYYIRCVRDQ